MTYTMTPQVVLVCTWNRRRSQRTPIYFENGEAATGSYVGGLINHVGQCSGSFYALEDGRYFPAVGSDLGTVVGASPFLDPLICHDEIEVIARLEAHLYLCGQRHNNFVVLYRFNERSQDWEPLAGGTIGLQRSQERVT